MEFGIQHVEFDVDVRGDVGPGRHGRAVVGPDRGGDPSCISTIAEQRRQRADDAPGTPTGGERPVVFTPKADRTPVGSDDHAVSW